jgi:hypothetical protein
MKQKVKVKVGEKVKFIRMDPEGAVHDGEGIVHALILDPDKRVQARVHELQGEGKYNLDLPSINPTAAERDAYIAHVTAIRSRANEINAAIAIIVTNGNAEIEKMNREFLGDPVVE